MKLSKKEIDEGHWMVTLTVVLPIGPETSRDDAHNIVLDIIDEIEYDLPTEVSSVHLSNLRFKC